ncbi:MAG: flagellar biosynthetic protein FliO [Gammaproteobacteria bacterium]|nr:flagellar biosynthetic protein FliO [Gammaproteobacteria bacterium]
MKRIKIKLNCVFLLFIYSSTHVYAVDQNTIPVVSSDPMSGHYLLQLIIGLIVVVACIVVLAWFTKRINRLQSSSGSLMTVLGGLSMGSREKVVLLQVGTQQLLIGVAPGRINTLHVLDTPVENVTAHSVNNLSESFADKLKGILKEGEK